MCSPDWHNMSTPRVASIQKIEKEYVTSTLEAPPLPYSHQWSKVIIILILNTIVEFHLLFISYKWNQKVSTVLCLASLSKPDIWERESTLLFHMYSEAYLRDSAGLVPYPQNKANIPVKGFKWIFGFPEHIKLMLTSFCSLLSVQWHYVYKHVHTLIKNIAKKC